MDQSTPPAEGKPTVESFITVCQCGEVKYNVKKRIKTSVVLECMGCGDITSVKGSLASVRIDQNEVAYAIREKVVRPNPDVGKGTKKEEEEKQKKSTLAEQGYRTLRFKINEEQYKVIHRALEAVRVLNFGEEKYQAVQWQGLALESICADFLGGVDPVALQVVDAMEEASLKLIEHYEVNEEKLPKRKIRDLRASVRDEMIKKLELFTNNYVEEELTAAEIRSRDEYAEATSKKEVEKAKDSRILDEDRMYKGIAERLVDFVDDKQASGEQRPKFLIVKPSSFKDVMSHRKREGGILLKLRGDERTKTAAGVRPTVYLWIDKIENMPELAMWYDEIYDKYLPDAELHITEMIKLGKQSKSGFETEELSK